jgi:hypothetical protein
MVKAGWSSASIGLLDAAYSPHLHLRSARSKRTDPCACGGVSATRHLPPPARSPAG